MKKNAIRIAVGLLIAAGSLSAHAALVNGSTLTIEKGSNFTMEVAPGFQLPTQITGHSGIVIGTSQATGASHGGAPTGTEAIASSIDNPWAFFGNTGLDYTSKPTSIVSQSGNKANLDFSGWTVTWNSVPAIAMGGQGGSWGSNPTGQAVVTFGKDGSNGDTYNLLYTAVVPNDGQTNFGGVHYGLNLTGHVIAPVVAGPVTSPGTAPVPVPGAVWLLGSALLGLVGVSRREAVA